MRSLIYVSAAVRLLKEAELLSILDSSRRHNQLSDVTGLLVYKNGNFIQVLEGTANAVEETMKRIRNDYRHHHLRVLLDQTIPEPMFGLWSMAFPGVHELTEEGLRKYSYSDSTKPYPQVGRQRVLRVLSSYRMMFEREIHPSGAI